MKNNYFYIAILFAAIGLLAFTVSANSNIISANRLNQAAAVSVASSNVNNLINNSVHYDLSAVSDFRTDVINSVKDNGRGGVGLMDTNKKIQIINKAKIRKIAAKALLRNDPLLFLSNTIPANIKALLPIEAQNEIETKKFITGIVDVMIIDDFKNPQNSHNEYSISIDGSKYNLYPVSDLNIVSGTKIQANGYVLDNDIVVDTNNDNVKVLESRVKLSYENKVFSSVGNQRTLVLLIKSYSTDNEPFTPVQAKDLVFNGQFQKFMQEQSYGKVSFSGDVFGWYTIGRVLSCYGGNNGAMPTYSELGKMVTQYGIDLQNYDRIVYLSTAGGFTYGACSDVGKSNYTINGKTYSFSQLIIEGLSDYDKPSYWGAQSFGWTNLDATLSHEMGHSLGVLHANGWSCSNNQILYGNCQHIEYGNPYDVMGTRGYSLDYNAYFKYQLGWIPPYQTLSATQTGSYEINPLEIQNGIKLIKVNIENTNISPYFVEFRKAIGFDSNLSSLYLSDNQKGIFVNRIQDGLSPATELLDMTPGPDSWANYIKQATLNYLSTSSPNRLFVDEGRGITIGPVLNISTSSIRFDVDFKQPSCSHLSPSMDYPYFSTYVSAGSSGYFNVFIKNNDYYGCEPSIFDVSLVSPQWKVEKYPTEGLVLASDKSGYKNLIYSVPVDTVPGVYAMEFNILNKSTGLTISKIIQVTVTEPLTIKETSPVFGPVGTVVSITGTGFTGEKNQVNVSMCGIGCSSIQILTSSNGKIVYTIPNEIQVCDSISHDCHNIPTPNGDYKIYISTNNAFANTDFHVGGLVIKPLVSLANNKTLSLKYDSVGGESELVSTFDVLIFPGSEDQRVVKKDAFWSYVKDERGQITTYGQITYPQPPGTIDDGNGYYIIPSKIGTTTFTVTAKFNPKTMFAGTYYGVMRQVTLGDTKPIIIIFPEPNITNKVTLIGEVSPYLNSIFPNPSDSDAVVTILGTRLPTSGNVVNLIDKITKVKKTVSAAGSAQSINFKPSVSPGEYIVNVTHPTTGDSNQLSLIVNTSSKVSRSVSIGDKKVLSLKYDSTGGESELVSTFDVSIFPGDKDQKIYKTNAFGLSLKQDDYIMVNNGQITYPQPPGTIDDGNGYYIIPSKIGTTTFTVTAKFNPKTMFAGTYYGVMGYVIFGYMDLFRVLSSNTTNKITIIGELSPYINSISSPKEGVASDATVIISGVRFPSKGNVVNLANISTGQKTKVFAMGSENGTKLQFKPAVTPGEYIVSVTHPITGDSNDWYLVVIPPASPFSPALFKFAPSITEQKTNTSSAPSQSPSAIPTTAPSPQYSPAPLPTTQPAPQASPSPTVNQTSSIFDSFEIFLNTVFRK